MKIGAITPIWNQERFIKPHFEMLEQLDKHVVMLQPGPLGNYQKEHGIGKKPDRSASIIRKLFPKTIIKYSKGHDEFSHQLYNEILPHVQDMDIVFRLDVDMFWTDKHWEQLLEFMRQAPTEVYRMNFSEGSINYYMNDDFDHGVKDALEFDPIAFSPKKPLIWTGALDYPSDDQLVIPTKFLCHHLRGWNKPKSIDKDWYKKRGNWVKKYGGWISAPKEIRDKLEAWTRELQQF